MDDIIERFRNIHGDTYDYSNVKYEKMEKPVDIICRIHGSFSQTPHGHLKGNGCPECGKISRIKKRMDTTESFIVKAKRVHGDKYDYSKVNYINSKTEVEIICPKHGSFIQKPNYHLNGEGCPKCGKESSNNKLRMSKELFIEKANKKHKWKYDYSKVNYINSKIDVEITCPIHGPFKQKPVLHLKGCGCCECGKIANSFFKRERASDEFINKAKKIHGNKYDYSKVEYVDVLTDVCIICPTHGEFRQTPRDHLSGCGCQKCGIESVKSKLSMSLEQFIEKANKVHHMKYDYSNVNYINTKTNVKIICPIHGEFEQTPYNHLNGCGCPKCSSNHSKAEDEIINVLNGVECEHNNRTVLNGKEIDVYIPSLKLGIEYNGLHWHSEEFGRGRNYHLDKLNDCNLRGVKLIQIFEDEWVNCREICESKLKHIANIDTDKEKIFARKCEVREACRDEAQEFLTRNHIQGYVGATLYLGLYYKDKLVALMDFKEEKENYWDLNRFSTDIKYNCIGAGGKLFKYFTSHYAFKEIKSFADRRWTTNPSNNLYTKLGFELTELLRPDYRYIMGSDINRYHKFSFRKQKLHKKYGVPLEMTEYEMTKSLGFYRIWDCGLIKYVYTNKETKID